MKKYFYIFAVILIVPAICWAATGFFDGSGNWRDYPTINSSNINWTSLNKDIQTSGVNWNSVVNTEIYSAGINWSDVNGSINSSAVNWSDVNRNIQNYAINWVSLNQDIQNAAVNWTDIDTSSGKAACWNGSQLSHCTSVVDVNGGCTCP